MNQEQQQVNRNMQYTTAFRKFHKEIHRLEQMAEDCRDIAKNGEVTSQELMNLMDTLEKLGVIK